MQYNLFDHADFSSSPPFEGRSLCALGTFSMPAKQLQKHLLAMGADFKPSAKVSRNVHYVLVGRGAPQDQLEYLETLAFHGYCPRVLYQEDLDRIFQGHYDSYAVPLEIRKQLHLTYRHYQLFRMEQMVGQNPLYTKELYVAPDTRTPQHRLYQLLGDRGVYANPYIDDTTDVLVVSDSTLQHLQEGNSDAVIQYIEETYNASRAQSYRYALTSESELLAWLDK